MRGGAALCYISAMKRLRVLPCLPLMIAALAGCLLMMSGALLGRALWHWAGADGMTIAALTPAAQRQVRIGIDGASRQLQTRHRQPLPILAQADIQLGEADKVWVNGALARQDALPAWTIPVSRIDIRRAIALRIIDDGAEFSLLTSAETIGEALQEAGIALQSHDDIDTPLSARLDSPVTVRISRAMPVTVLVDGREIQARAQATTVGALLDELALPLGALDFTRPALDAEVRADMQIAILRVHEEEIVEREEIPPGEPEYRPDSNTALDRRTVLRGAQPGIRETVTRVRYENGVEVSRETGEPQLVQEAQHEIIGYGTNAKTIGTIQTPAGPREYWRVLCMYATSYHPGSNSGNTLTATGATLRTGIVASRPYLIPYGSQVFVPGYGIGLMADTGRGPLSSEYWIDLGFSDADYTRDWHDYVKVYLLTPAKPGNRALLPAWTPVRSDLGNCN